MKGRVKGVVTKGRIMGKARRWDRQRKGVNVNKERVWMCIKELECVLMDVWMYEKYVWIDVYLWNGYVDEKIKCINTYISMHI